MAHIGFIEKLLHRIEDHVEEWRREDAARKAKAEANRERLWAEATEREKLLHRELEEAGREAPPGEERRIVFIVHTAEAGHSLDALIGERARLVSRVPGKSGLGGSTGLDGSWLIFEDHGG